MPTMQPTNKPPTLLHLAGMRDAIAALDACLESIEACALLPEEYERLERAIASSRSRLMDSLRAAERAIVATAQRPPNR